MTDTMTDGARLRLVEIKTMMRKALDEGDMETFKEGLRMVELCYPDVWREMMVELEKIGKLN